MFSVNSEPIIEFDLHLHGNKRNERNEMYRRRLTDEVYWFPNISFCWLWELFSQSLIIRRDISSERFSIECQNQNQTKFVKTSKWREDWENIYYYWVGLRTHKCSGTNFTSALTLSSTLVLCKCLWLYNYWQMECWLRREVFCKQSF